MEDDDDDLDAKAAVEAFLDFEARADARNRARAVHEAGHTVVALALGANIEFVEVNLVTGNGGSRSSTFDDQTKNLAVCVAGCRAEHLLDARNDRRTKIGDFRLMREQLARVPEAHRRAARAAGYQLADKTLQANFDAVRRIADALLTRERIADTSVVRIAGDELSALLSPPAQCAGRRRPGTEAGQGAKRASDLSNTNEHLRRNLL